MKKTFSALAVVLAILLLCSACSIGVDESSINAGKYPDYLNLESAYPIVKEGSDPITLKVLFVVSEQSGDWDDLWISKYLSDKYNVNLDVELVRGNSAKGEIKNIVLNSGELPDMIWNMNFSTSEIVKYGVEEELFLKMDNYINETLTPGLMEYWTDAVQSACTAQDGHVYTLPMLSDSVDVQPVTDGRMFINTALLKKLNLEIPHTLDEFISAMYEMKKDSTDEDFYPMGSGSSNPFETVFWYMLNAFGYNTVSPFGVEPCLRDGKVVIPAYDGDTYYEYLSLMNQLYRDGIINPDVFTIDTTEINSMMDAGQTALYSNAPFVAGIDSWDQWESCYPLISKWQKEPEAIAPDTISVGGFVISADTEYPELCMRIADIFFNNKTDCCAAVWGGTGEGTEYDYDGYTLYEWNEEKEEWFLDESKLPEGCDIWTYHLEYLNGAMPSFGAYDLEESRAALCKSLGHSMNIEFVPDFSSGEGAFESSTYFNMAPYVVESYPTVYYIDEDTAQQILDLETVVIPYIKEQTASFIVGRRPLSEYYDYQQELTDMGMDTLLEIYSNIYTAS